MLIEYLFCEKKEITNLKRAMEFKSKLRQNKKKIGLLYRHFIKTFPGLIFVNCPRNVHIFLSPITY